ncbi:MAG: hypothetical protein OXC44_05790 [Proteobacteria bacterium]|nr:hypothetical protein [Pseudomonadota bacterium]
MLERKYGLCIYICMGILGCVMCLAVLSCGEEDPAQGLQPPPDDSPSDNPEDPSYDDEYQEPEEGEGGSGEEEFPELEDNVPESSRVEKMGVITYPDALDLCKKRPGYLCVGLGTIVLQIRIGNYGDRSNLMVHPKTKAANYFQTRVKIGHDYVRFRVSEAGNRKGRRYGYDFKLKDSTLLRAAVQSPSPQNWVEFLAVDSGQKYDLFLSVHSKEGFKCEVLALLKPGRVSEVTLAIYSGKADCGR